MGDDFHQLKQAEQRLLEAVKAAGEVTAKLSAGETQELEELCSRFLDNIQASQLALVELAAKYAEPLPYENSACGSQLELEAAQHKLQAAQEQQLHLQRRAQQQQRGQGGNVDMTAGD